MATHTQAERTLIETGTAFTRDVERRRQLIQEAEATMAKIGRQVDAEVQLDRRYSTELEATLAMREAQAARRAPALAQQRARITTLRDELADLHEARHREVQRIRAAAVLGSEVPAVAVPDWRTAAYDALSQQHAAAVDEAASLDAELATAIGVAASAREQAGALGAMVRMGTRKPAAWDTALRDAAEADKALSVARERVRSHEGIIDELARHRDALEQRLRAAWARAQETELRACAKRVVEALRVAMREHVQFTSIFEALDGQGSRPDGTGPCHALDVTDEYAAVRLWIETLQRAGWVT